MGPNSSDAPSCEKCGAPMRQMASMPALELRGKLCVLFHCEPCDRIKWTRNKAASVGGPRSRLERKRRCAPRFVGAAVRSICPIP
jgi:hypothetical protein